MIRRRWNEPVNGLSSLSVSSDGGGDDDDDDVYIIPSKPSRPLKIDAGASSVATNNTSPTRLENDRQQTIPHFQGHKKISVPFPLAEHDCPSSKLSSGKIGRAKGPEDAHHVAFSLSPPIWREGRGDDIGVTPSHYAQHSTVHHVIGKS